MKKGLITICVVVLMLSATGVSWAIPVAPGVNPPPIQLEWWNVECEYYAYGWWEADIEPVPGAPASPLISPPDDPTHWASNFLDNTAFTAGVVEDIVTIHLDNVYREELYKEIFIYLRGTTTAGDGESISGILDTDDGTFTGGGMFNIGAGQWYYAIIGEIHPQPDWVNLTVTVPGLTCVTDIWAGENCLPEPATICLLGLGSLVLLRKKRRGVM